MSSYLSHESNSILRELTVASKFQIEISNLRGKIVQNVKFSSVSQNSDLSSKLDSTRQMTPGVYSVFKTKLWK